VEGILCQMCIRLYVLRTFLFFWVNVCIVSYCVCWCDCICMFCYVCVCITQFCVSMYYRFIILYVCMIGFGVCLYRLLM